jgi:ATP-dependent DNA ligase
MREQSAGRTISTHRQAIQKCTEPAFLEPMQCKPVTALPAGEKWTFEVKFDGYGRIVVKRGREVTPLTSQEGAQQALFQRRPGARVARE